MGNGFILHDEYKIDYSEKIKSGIEFLKNKKIALVGLCRSVETIIENNIDLIESIFRDKCKVFNIVLFENDSKDNTKIVLKKLQKKYHNLDIISQDYNRPQFGPTTDKARTAALAEYRNILKNYVANNFHHYDFIIVFDTDYKEIAIDGIYNSFGWFNSQKDIHAISGNSFEYKRENNILWNYDCWAYRGSWWHDWTVKPSTHNAYNPAYWFGIWILPVGSPPVQANSAFGGMTIYKTKYYLSGNYSGEDCEHVTFHKSITDNHKNFKLVLNPSQIMLL